MISRNTAAKYKYMDLYSWVTERIKDGTFTYNSKLPSEAELCNRFNYSRQTVRNALELLAKDGYISSIKGSGSYVKKHIQPREKVIGVLFTVVSGYIGADIINGMERVFTSRGYSIQLELSHHCLENETRFLNKMCESQVSGLIIEPTKSNFPTPNAGLYRKLDEMGIPCVFVNGYYSNIPCNAVVWDDEQVARKLTSRLIEAGHRKIGSIFLFDEIQGARRYQGYVSTLIENGIPIDEDLMCWCCLLDGYNEYKKRQDAMIDSFLDYAAENCTALICYNDLIASTVINKLRTRNIRIPEQLLIVSFDNSDLVKFFGLENGFYSFSHPKGQIGQTAANLLLSLIQDKFPMERQIITVTSPDQDIRF